MDKVELLSFPSPVELANNAADDWIARIAARPQDAENYCVALSGGRIAKTFSSAVAELAKARKYSFPSIHFFWGDERCVPPTDAESNFAIAQERLFEPLGISEKQIHRIRGEDQPAHAAAAAEAELRKVAAKTSADGQPIFDMIFLGIGEDGHTASLFPTESPEMTTDKSVYRAVVGSKPPPNRVTLGYQAIAAAEQVWVLASGAGKERAFWDSYYTLSNPLKPIAQTPFWRVLNLRRYTKIYSDIPGEEPWAR
jgi:6-phosphogluconolactonase